MGSESYSVATFRYDGEDTEDNDEDKSFDELFNGNPKAVRLLAVAPAAGVLHEGGLASIQCSKPAPANLRPGFIAVKRKLSGGPGKSLRLSHYHFLFQSCCTSPRARVSLHLKSCCAVNEGNQCGMSPSKHRRVSNSNAFRWDPLSSRLDTTTTAGRLLAESSLITYKAYH